MRDVNEAISCSHTLSSIRAGKQTHHRHSGVTTRTKSTSIMLKASITRIIELYNNQTFFDPCVDNYYIWTNGRLQLLQLIFTCDSMKEYPYTIS
jgi:hypothetical protein